MKKSATMVFISNIPKFSSKIKCFMKNFKKILKKEKPRKSVTHGVIDTLLLFF